MIDAYRTYIYTKKGYEGKGRHNLKRTIKLLDKLIYEEHYNDKILIVIEEDHTDIPIMINSTEEYEEFRSEHYETQIRDVPTKYKSLHRKN